jgi:uncharacterized membrane protein
MTSAYVLDWLSLVGRWVHLVTGIAWIGASFYFIWLDNHLLPPTDEALSRRGVGGELWAVHGGGFYHAQKYRIAPETLPPTLHWFYWEAYSTWLSGFFLLVLLYYAQADIYLIDPRVAPLSKPVAIALGLAFILGGWVAYDALCRSPLARHGKWLGAVLAVLFSAAAFALCHLFSGRGAFIQFGAMLGTIMVANVFFVIIPGQREMVRAKREGRAPSPDVGTRGKLRSVHNTYFTLPVLFTMISNHYALTFGGERNWLVLMAISAAGALIRVYFVARHKRHERGGRTSPWTAVIGLLILAATATALAPRPLAWLGGGTGAGGGTGGSADAGAPRFEAIRQIVAARCVPCHSAAPTQPGFATAPQGLKLDTPDAIVTHAAMMGPLVEAGAMPLGNLTRMTDTERTLLLDWIQHGAPH